VTTKEQRARLSTHVVFVDYGLEVEVQHTVRASKYRIERTVYEDLLRFRGFQEPEERHRRWVDVGVLVPPFKDNFEYQGGLRLGSEAQLARDYQDWYWRHEIESEREYRWLGHGIGKMPTDLFLYQELMAAHSIRSVLEIGYGNGGGIWFFATVLRALGGGMVAGVDSNGGTNLPPFATIEGVGVALVTGDAHAQQTQEAVKLLRPEGFSLVVIDADPDPVGKIRLLQRWAESVAPNGFLFVEDVESPRCRDVDPQILVGIDGFLLERTDFRIAVEAARTPLLKARGAALQRCLSTPPPLSVDPRANHPRQPDR